MIFEKEIIYILLGNLFIISGCTLLIIVPVLNLPLDTMLLSVVLIPVGFIFLIMGLE